MLGLRSDDWFFAGRKPYPGVPLPELSKLQTLVSLRRIQVTCTFDALPILKENSLNGSPVRSDGRRTGMVEV